MKVISLCLLRIYLTFNNISTYWTTRLWACYWGMLQQLVYKTKSKDIHVLRECIVGKWGKLDQCIINKVIKVAKETLSLCGCWRRTV